MFMTVYDRAHLPVGWGQVLILVQQDFNDAEVPASGSEGEAGVVEKLQG